MDHFFCNFGDCYKKIAKKKKKIPLKFWPFKKKKKTVKKIFHKNFLVVIDVHKLSNFYYQLLPQQTLCAHVELLRVSEVASVKPATFKAYDYYEPGKIFEFFLLVVWLRLINFFQKKLLFVRTMWTLGVAPEFVTFADMNVLDVPVRTIKRNKYPALFMQF